MVIQKNKRGRPRSGRNPLPLVAFRMKPAEIRLFDKYCAARKCTRSQAIRFLIRAELEQA